MPAGAAARPQTTRNRTEAIGSIEWGRQFRQVRITGPDLESILYACRDAAQSQGASGTTEGTSIVPAEVRTTGTATRKSHHRRMTPELQEKLREAGRRGAQARRQTVQRSKPKVATAAA